MAEGVGQYVVLAGNIGVGKTSLAEGLAARLGWRVGREGVEGNAYLIDFYHDPSRWAFLLAMHNLEQRLRQHRELRRRGENVVLDRSIYEDRYIFVEMQRDTGLLSERDYRCYIAFWDLLVEKMPVPNVLIYLYAPIDVLIKRIKNRGRTIEEAIDSNYLEQLQIKYNAWIGNFNICPVISIYSGEEGNSPIDTSIKHLLKFSQNN